MIRGSFVLCTALAASVVVPSCVLPPPPFAEEDAGDNDPNHDGGDAGQDKDAGDVVVPLSEPPEIRSTFVTLLGDPEISADLSTAHGLEILPATTDLLFKFLVVDDETDTADLTVSIVDMTTPRWRFQIQF